MPKSYHTTGDQIILRAIAKGHTSKQAITSYASAQHPGRNIQSYLAPSYCKRTKKWSISPDGLYALTTPASTSKSKNIEPIEISWEPIPECLVTFERFERAIASHDFKKEMDAWINDQFEDRYDNTTSASDLMEDAH